MEHFKNTLKQVRFPFLKRKATKKGLALNNQTQDIYLKFKN
jgi:hypothetical protein